MESLNLQKKLKVIELFAGYGSIELALKYSDIDFSYHKICEWFVSGNSSIQRCSYL